MDDGVTDGVAPTNGIYIQAKENEHVAKTEGHKMATPTSGEFPVGSNSNIPTHLRDNKGVAVEELTLKHYNGENLSIVGTSNSRDGTLSRPNQWQHLFQLPGGSKSGQDSGITIFPELLNENLNNVGKTVETEHTTSNNENQAYTGIRTKMLSKSGVSEFFVKSSLKGKGIIHKGPAREGFRNPSNLNITCAPMVSDVPLLTGKTNDVANTCREGVCLREWLRVGRRKASKLERLYIFRQILNIVDSSHSQGLSLQYLRPSCFSLSATNQVGYLGSFVPQENEENTGKRTLGHFAHPLASNKSAKKQKIGEKAQIRLDSSSYDVSICGSDMLEESWYASPEDRMGRGSWFSSNVYDLGVLLFELLGCFDSESARAAAMSDLRHRILPSNFLSENPKEAGFCLWLLHPEPSSRPTAREVLKSDVVSGIEESFGDELCLSIDEDETESELLSYFLLTVKEQKEKDSMKLEEEIKCIEEDIEEVVRRTTGKTNAVFTPGTSGSTRFDKNISQLESAYCSMRSDIRSSINDVATRAHSNPLREREINRPSDRVGDFFSGLCKYARYSKFEVRGVLRNGEFNSGANVICSMGFDRDQEYFASAGISKKIKVFEFHSLLDEGVDVHYPAVEMLNKSRLSCVCWNSYIRSYLASTDYDGTVKLWDAGSGQVVSEFSEHNKRAWSVDFSQSDPTKLASGSDDYSVKLWSINQKNSLGTIKSIANTCCVQFSGYSSHLLAFGSADYKTYIYDLRNVSVPWCILAGHDKAVSYVKFLDSETLVSASTDNTLKIWDLNKTNSLGLSTSACVLTSKGHTNEKNFVGLSVSDGYIACGSETNEVYGYYKSLPMPITAHKFGSIDPVSGVETDDDNGQFVSSVCWKQNSDILLAANSTGSIKVLQMV